MHTGVPTRRARRVAAVVSIVALTVALASACGLPGAGLASLSGRIIIPGGVSLTEDNVIDVSLHRPGDGLTAPTVTYTLARPDGTYSISGVAPGDYTVYVSVWDAGLAPQWWGGATTARDADVLRLEPGEHRADIDVALVEGAILAGTVSMPPDSRHSAEHAWVTVWDADQRMTMGESAVTPAGEFVVSGLAAGDYKIEVTPPNGIAARQWWGGASEWTGADVVSVEASVQRDGLDVALTAGGTLSGEVRGVAATEYGASVYAWLLADDGEWEQGSWAETESDGTYTIRGLAPGRYAVEFSRPIGDRPWDAAATAMWRTSSEAEPSHEKYWDDTPDRESADLVVVGEGERITGVSADLDVPPPFAG